MAFLKTRYYGGIRKYQWTAIPLALHGVVIKKNGECVSVCIGESDADPVFYINDLLPHLAQDQNTKPLGSAVSGESLNILVGGMPYPDSEVSDAVKLNVLNILNERYGISELDFQSAELCAVPAFKARDIGFDRALIGAVCVHLDHQKVAAFLKGHAARGKPLAGGEIRQKIRKGIHLCLIARGSLVRADVEQKLSIFFRIFVNDGKKLGNVHFWLLFS